MVECWTTWEETKNRYIQAPIFISPKWELEFHVHTDASQLVVREILAQNLTSEFDQSNSTKKKNCYIKRGFSYGLCLTQA
jgi:hypothetical protein